MPCGLLGVAPVAAVGGGGRSGWRGVEVYMKPGGGCGGMLTFGLSATSGGGRVAGLRTGRDGRTGGEGPGCCPPEEESEEVLLEGGEPDEWRLTTGEEGVVAMPASSVE